MSKWSIYCTTFCAVLMLVSAAGAGSDFTGTWVLDKSKSEGLGRMYENADSVTMTVTQSEKDFKVQQKVVVGGEERGAQESMYKLDGTETTAERTGRIQGTATLKAKWVGEGNILELHSVLKGNFQGNEFISTTTEHWELDEGGKILKVHRKTEGPRGAQESKLVFSKM